MAGDGEEKIIVEGRELGEFILQELRNFGSAHAFLRDHGLRGLGEDLVR